MRKETAQPLQGFERKSEKSFSLIEQLSPDGLFMRSKLLVHNAELNDFGKYNCTIVNSLAQDSMIIELEPLAATGKFLPLPPLLVITIAQH